ncbi:fibro-slime domain-containing protein [Ruminococcus sp.]|uniref:fibro-slime domain-containing protein n=1 Tax=Ruminococcus sp. TaxID=41978 RepID=UPI002E795950|nr:fibro-slime domain-containing protein [Ruminococcus sp.]MEE1262700.1 fibro-slime domain-containing protein [Ruminococcus sp.]
MKTRLKHMTKSTVSVLLSLLMIVSAFTVGVVGTDAANTSASDPVGAQLTEDDSVSAKTEDDGETVGAKVEDDSEVGAMTYYLLLGDNNNNPSGWTKYVSSSSQSFTVTPSSLGLSSFETNHNYYVGISSSTSYTNMWSQGGSSAIGTKTGSIKEAAAQDFNIASTRYNFARFQLNSAVDSVKVTTSHSSGATTYNFSTGTSTWTVVGNSTELFGTAWDYTATANDMTGSGTSYTWSKSNVSLTAGTISYRVAKNHASTTVYPSTAATQTVSSTGVYDVTVTYNDSTHEVNMTLTDRTPHTLTVGSPGNAVLTAAYNGTTANEGGTLSVPAGSTVNVYVTPDTGYKLASITSTAGGATSVSGNKGTLTMPAADTTLNITLADAGKKTIYFNNMNTLYAMVSAKYTYNGSTTSNTMTRLSNSNIWSIEVPADLTEITFVGDNGYNTGSMSIPNTTAPKYTAPTNKTAPTTANGGRWGEYTARANEVIVTNGSSITNGINNGTLFAGITATMYDYYADGEVSSGATNWLTGINTTANSKEYTTNNNDWKWNSFTKLNSALSAYASTHSVTYPLYFGNLNVTSYSGSQRSIDAVGLSSSSTVLAYTNWNQLANGSISLNDANSGAKNAVTGLSGKTLANSNIHYYSSSDSTNENGAIMAMFDEDFLSGENTQNAALATILRSSFPVHIENRGGTTTYENKIYVDAKGFDPGSGELWAHFYDANSHTKDELMTKVGDYYVCDIPTSFTPTNVIFVRQASSGGTAIDWNNKWNESNSCGVPSSSTDAGRLYTFSNSSDASGTFSKGDIASSYGTTSGGYKYYQFNSDGGKDNAYVKSITKPTSSATGSATLEYYENSNKVYSAEYGNDKKAAGFFPFDNNNFINRVDKHAHDLGFGMKLEIPFTLNENGVLDDGTTPQTFDFSGDDDLWVFIDNKLVLDLGGEHNKTEGTINFSDCSITANNKQAIASGVTRNGKFGTNVEGGWFDNSNPNTVHTMTIYYMERGMFDSNLMFGFSFHAIPNQLKTEKKVRTANINSGFYVLNDTTKSDTTVDDGARYVTWFEKSYQYENFNIVQKSDTKPTDKEGTGKVTYSLRGATNYSTYGTAAQDYAINYNLNNDNIAYFLDQYKSGTNITLTESTAGNSNRYNYDQSVVVYDDANNGAVVTGTGDISTGYTFEFGQTVHTDLDNLNLRARITNQMKSHNLTVTKTLNDPDDTTSEFTLQFLFNFDMAAVAGINTATTKGYHAYPLYVKVNGTETQLNADGTITIKPGDILELIKIPENAQMQILETIPADSKYGYGSTTVTNGADVTTVANGVQFKMGTTDSTAVIHNVKGSLQITHQLHPDSTAIGNTLVSAKVKDGSTDIATYAETPGEDGISIDPQYIKSDSTYDLEIVLRSEVVDTISYFEDFYEQIITGTMNLLAASGTPYTAVINKASRTATITVPISGLFTSGTQTYTLLPFYSKFITSVYKYKLHFDFQGYRDLYGYLGYDYSEQTFTMAELDEYFAISDDVVDTNSNKVTAPVFKDDDARQSFINLKAPYENTFMETVKWQTDMYDAETHPEGMTATYNGETNTWTYVVKLKKTPNRFAFATFRFPYTVDAYTNKHAAQTTSITYGEDTFDAVQLLTDGAYNEYGGRSNTETQYRTGYGDNYKISGDYVTAPTRVWDTSTNSFKYFSYWSVWNVADAASKTGSSEYTRCYYPEFNLSLYQDSIITPVYNHSSYLSPSERAQADDAARTDSFSKNGRATITMMENSRMQWTAGRPGNTLSGTYINGGDRIYTDFLVSYTYQDLMLNTDTTGMKAGIVVETVRELDHNEGVYFTKTQAEYAQTDNSSINKSDIKAFAEGGTNANLLKTEFSVTTLDNKNRKNQYYSLPNISQTTHEATTRKIKLYRAYSYLKNSSGKVLLVSDPIYFTIYDIASISNMQGGASYGGVS